MEKNFHIYQRGKQPRDVSREGQSSLPCATEMPRQKFGLRVMTTLKNNNNNQQILFGFTMHKRKANKPTLHSRKNNDLLKFAGKWMDLESIILREVLSFLMD